MARQFNSPVAADCGDKMVLAGLIRKLGNCLCCPGSEEPSGLGVVVLGSGGRVARSPLLSLQPADRAHTVWFSAASNAPAAS